MATNTSVQAASPVSVVKPFRVHRVTECANLTCFNRSSEGQFGVATISSQTGRHRAVSLLLCMPCIEALSEVVGR